MPEENEKLKSLKSKLSELSSTLFIPLWARAVEVTKPNAIIVDEKAVEVFETLNPDVSTFANAKLSQLGCASRAKIIDEEIRNFIQVNSGCTVINFACGLDTREYRLKDLDYSTWVNCDLKEVIEIREQLKELGILSEIPGKKVVNVTSDLLKENFLEELKPYFKETPVIAIFEGVLMYFEERSVNAILTQIVSQIKKGAIVAELLAPVLLKHQDKHDAVSNGPRFRWAPNNPKRVANSVVGLKLKKVRNLTEISAKRWGLFGLISRLPILKNQFNQRIALYEWE